MAKSLKAQVGKTQVGSKRTSSARSVATTSKRAPARRARIVAEHKPTRRSNKSSAAAEPVIITKREGFLPEPVATFTF